MQNVNGTAVPQPLVVGVNKQRLWLMAGLAPVAWGVTYFFLGRVELIILGICVIIAVIYGLKEAIWGDSKVTIDSQGVTDSRLGLGTARWRDIRNVYVKELHNVPHVCLEVSSTDQYLRDRSAATRGLLKFHQKRQGIPAFNINTGVLELGAGEIYHAIMANWEYYRRLEN